MINFFEAFPDLSVEDRLFRTFSDVSVDRVQASKSKNVVRIALEGTTILSYRDIKKMEEKLAKQIFGSMSVYPRIDMHYSSMSELTLSELIKTYESELYNEIHEKDRVLFSKFCTRHMEAKDENTLIITCDDDFICRQRSKKMGDFFTDILKRRFDKDVMVKFIYIKREKKPQKDLVYEYISDDKVSDDNEKKEDINTSVDISVARDGNGDNKKDISDDKRAKSRDKKPYKKSRKKPAKDPSLFYGRNIDGEVTAICDMADGLEDVVIDGMIRKVDTREYTGKNGDERLIITFTVTDFTDTIAGKIFIKKEDANETSIYTFISVGNFIRIKGRIAYDSYDHEIRITGVQGMKEIDDFRVGRTDTAHVKRVELHAHTQMSDMDGLTNCKSLVKRAKSWGHPAIAITDHGVTQSFPEAYHALDKDDDFKVIYGCEIYLVDDLEETVINPKGQSLDDTYVVFDLETTGFSPERCKIIEIGAVKVSKGEIIDRFSTFVNPGIPIPPRITELTSIENKDVADAPDIESILPEFLNFCEGAVLVAHNARFDHSFIKANASRLGIDTCFTVVDTIGMAQVQLTQMSRYQLHQVAKALKIPPFHHHRAVDDAEATAEIFKSLIRKYKKDGICDLDALYERTHLAPEITRKRMSFHAIVLAKNEVGRVNLYKLVSDSHTTYYHQRPRVPKSELIKRREGLIVGSACEAGELFRAILDDADEEKIRSLVKFYDYLEIQPVENNAFMIESDRSSYEEINSLDDIREINRQIVSLGEKYDKPVCATCDVHFLDPEDEVYRRILFAGKKMKDAENQAPLYLRTTDEMLAEFSYLGEDKAMEVVVTNTNRIADQIEVISPVFPDKCPPVIPDSDKQLRQICYRKAHSMYGDPLPEIVSERLERELNSIISNGFAVMYIIAQKLVWKSNEDGYLVGSRGSVGSSFVATMSGITEVNPLPAHYYCGECHYTDFDSDEVKAFAGSSGYDMPQKNCPNCGKPLIRDGHDIPFETFLGFYGNKEPDIDLNFSGEYQSKAHAYTEVIFGDGQTLRAGTIGTLADKTAFGFVKNYYDERDIHKRREEIDRIIEGMVGVRRTTGQHPGGIVVLPTGWDINVFTPIQHPANDMDTPIVTTHYDYHSIDHNLLKLDILGHDDPTLIRHLEDLTGVDALSIPLDDPDVMSLFSGTKALGVTPDELMGLDLGSLGVPEMGTDFVMQMLRDTKPKNFSDLVRISGLSHGTDVWLNNAQYYIKNGDCTLSTAICTRDDIMTYLIYAGVEKGLAFDIMEKVRKGLVAKGLVDKWDEWKQIMLSCGVPEWYIESCGKIKYMFPKAHAVAYVMMALRIAYFKVHYPLAYYAAFFSDRAKAFDYEVMCQGKDKLEAIMTEYKKRMDSGNKEDELTPKDVAMYGDMRIVQEMYARGYDFIPIDIFEADAKHFKIIDGKLMPSLNTIAGLGDTAAEGIMDAAKDGPFRSCDDLKNRAKISGTNIDKMRELRLLEGLPLSNQMSLLDFA